MAHQQTSRVGPGDRFGGTLIERERELAGLSELVDALASGAPGGVAVIEGAAGVGKSSVLRSAIDGARGQDLTVLTALGTAVADDLPWLGVRELFEPALRSLPDAEMLLTGAASLTAAVLRKDAGPQRAADVSSAALHGLYWLVANLAERGPVLVAIDDVHLIDRPTLRWLVYLGRRLSDLPVLVVVTTPPGRESAGPELCALLDAATNVIPLSELSDEAAASLVHHRFGESVDAEFCSACVAVTRGNPFLLRELLEELERDGVAPTAANAERVSSTRPANVNRMVLLRVTRAGADAVKVASAVAILGADASLRNVAELADLDEDTTAAKVRELEAGEVLERALPLRLMHPLVRSVVYENLAPAERTRWHRRAASLLARRGAAASAVAAQLLACEPSGDPVSVRLLRDAAAEAVRTGAPETAVRFLRRARDEVEVNADDPGLLRELGSAEASVGDPKAIEHLRSALELETMPGCRGETAQTLASVLTRSGRSREAVTLLDQAIAELDGNHAQLRLRLEGEALAAAREDFATSPLIPERIAKLGDVEGATGAELVLLANMAMLSATSGDSARDTEELALRALSRGRLLDEETADSPACYLAIHSLVAADRADLAVKELDKAFAEARGRGSVMGIAIASICASHAHLSIGDVGIAISHARTALEIGQSAGWVGMTPWSVAFLVNALVARDELDEARTEIERAGLAGDLPEAPFFAPLASARARLALAVKDPEGALRMARLGELSAASGSVNPAMSSWRSEKALALAALGREREAGGLVDEELALALAYGAPRPIGAALRACALLASQEEGIDLLRDAVQILEDSPARLELAGALVDLGAALRRDGLRRDAREPLRRGLELATSCGATALATQARAELAASGARARREALTGPAALTPAELRVARMAADGLANREIAESLFVTLRTVELHLTHAYQKLSISSRAELGDALDS